MKIASAHLLRLFSFHFFVSLYLLILLFNAVKAFKQAWPKQQRSTWKYGKWTAAQQVWSSTPAKSKHRWSKLQIGGCPLHQRISAINQVILTIFIFSHTHTHLTFAICHNIFENQTGTLSVSKYDEKANRITFSVVQPPSNDKSEQEKIDEYTFKLNEDTLIPVVWGFLHGKLAMNIALLIT